MLDCIESIQKGHLIELLAVHVSTVPEVCRSGKREHGNEHNEKRDRIVQGVHPCAQPVCSSARPMQQNGFSPGLQSHGVTVGIILGRGLTVGVRGSDGGQVLGSESAVPISAPAEHALKTSEDTQSHIAPRSAPAWTSDAACRTHRDGIFGHWQSPTNRFVQTIEGTLTTFTIEDQSVSLNHPIPEGIHAGHEERSQAVVGPIQTRRCNWHQQVTRIAWGFWSAQIAVVE